ncbi:hypothetical protein BGZ46_006611 [Entomortierella lignicola]|nr:hypothetical protein BGZ46_006611 [Entomortierella lignicola]
MGTFPSHKPNPGSAKRDSNSICLSEQGYVKRSRVQSDNEIHQLQVPDHVSSSSMSTTIIIPGSLQPPRLQKLPIELILTILWFVSDAKALWCISRTCKMINGLIGKKFWHNVYIIQTPAWSINVKINHLQGDVKKWTQMVLNDYKRRTLRWAKQPIGINRSLSLRADLGDALHCKPQHNSQWKNVGPPAIFTDQVFKTTITAYMQACPGEGRTNHQITVYALPDHENPITIIPSNFWDHKDADRQLERELATENLGPAQLMDMKHFPPRDGKIRVVFVVAFGERNQMPADSDDRDMYIIDVWSLLRIVEVFIPVSNSSIPSRPLKGRVETIAPRSRQEVIRIRIVRMYSAINQTNGEREDRIALFGIHQGSRLRTVLMTSPLLAASQKVLSNIKGSSSSIRPSSWDCHVLGGMKALEPSCMALFPAQSDFDNLLVILDANGDGEIWDWVKRVRVSELRLDGVNRETQTHREHLYYWGVHINFAIEEPAQDEPNSAFSLGSSRRACGDLRVVALSDGRDTEWETSWWNIDESKLRMRLSLEHVQDAEPWIINSSSRHFEHCTRGMPYLQHFPSENLKNQQQPQMQQLQLQQQGGDGNNGAPLMFIAYLIWDHYRIALTSDYGICIFDMDQELSGDILSESKPQWVTMIEGVDEDPLIDIATVGSCLFLTRKYSHMIWKF